MTGAETSFKNKKKGKGMADNRISTHPSYTEYSWDNLVEKRPGASAPNTTQSANAGHNTGSMPKVQVGRASQNTGTMGAVKGVSAAKADAGVKTYENKRERLRKKSIVAIHTIAVNKKYSFPISIVLIALCFTVLVMATITTSVQISEIVAENAMLERQYHTLVSNENELRLLLETRDDLRAVETLAKEEYGMVKKDQVERYYLTVHKEDKIEIIEEVEETKTGIFDDIMSFGGSIAKRVRNFFGF